MIICNRVVLPGAVRADQAGDRAGRHFEGAVAQAPYLAVAPAGGLNCRDSGRISGHQTFSFFMSCLATAMSADTAPSLSLAASASRSHLQRCARGPVRFRRVR
jgi:hypothetical protein